MTCLQGRVAVVTGAGQGLGRGITAALADEGASVALLGRTKPARFAASDAGVALAARIPAFGGHQFRVGRRRAGRAAETYRDEDPARFEQIVRIIPLRRFGDPYDDIGRAIVGLVSDDLHYLTGATLMLDGGQVMLR